MVDLNESMLEVRPSLTPIHSIALLMATSLQSLCVCLKGPTAPANSIVAAIATLRSLRKLHLIVPADANLGPLAQLSSLEDFALQTGFGAVVHHHHTAMASCVHVLRSSRNTLQAVQLHCFYYADDIYRALQCLPQLQTIMLKVFGPGLTPSAAACIGICTDSSQISTCMVS